MFDVAAVRKDFPILARTIRGKAFTYLDNAATSQRPAIVGRTLEEFYRTSNANVHRGVYVVAEEATQKYEGARERIAKFFKAATSRSIIFTRNTTEAVNLVAMTWGRSTLEAGDEIIVTDIEHHSNLVPWIRLSQEKRLSIKVWKATDEGLLDLKDFKALLSPRTRLVAVTHMSNVLGTIAPLAEIIPLAHQHHALVFVDGAQGAPHLPVDVTALDCDFYACSSHKMLGPTGIGVLYGKEDILKKMEPFLGGGEMIREVHFDRVTWNDLPWKFEAGTPNFGDAVAFAAALDYLDGLGMAQVRKHEEELTAYALDRVARMGSLMTVHGPKDASKKGGVLSFNIEGVHAHDVGTAMDMEGVAVRAGHHCAQPLMRRLGVVATARASFYLYNTQEEVDIFLKAVKQVHAFFAGSRVG